MTEADRIATPLYAQVGDTLSRRIAEGLYPLGTFLPTEEALCAEFDISRHTTREALRRLSEAGLVRRRQGSGSQVVASQPQRAYVHAMRSLDGLFQYAADTTFRIDSIGMGRPDPADLAVPGDWLIVAGLRIDPREGTAICTSTVYIAGEYGAIAPELRGRRNAIYPLIEERFGVQVADVEQQFSSCPMPATAARALGLGRKDWAVRVLRRYRDDRGALIIASVNHHPAARFSYTMSLRREERGV